MDCLKAVDKSNRAKWVVFINTTYFARFDFRRFETVHKTLYGRKVS